jgi:hypothetical protein
MNTVRSERDAFDNWVKSLPDTHWAKHDVSGCRLAWEACCQWLAGSVPSPAMADVVAELNRATTKFPTWPTDPLHAMGVLNEEVGELAKAVLQEVYEPNKNMPGDVRKEALQAAAMTLRFLVSIDTYRWLPSKQHNQEQGIDESNKDTAP